MPELCRFMGLVITMYHDDHPPPHFHVRYGAIKARIEIETLTLLEGRLTPRVRGLVVEWAAMHQAALRENWARARDNQPLVPIPPLE